MKSFKTDQNTLVDKSHGILREMNMNESVFERMVQCFSNLTTGSNQVSMISCCAQIFFNEIVRK